MMPWRLLADPSGYILEWLVGYSGGLGSIAGVGFAVGFVVHFALMKLSKPEVVAAPETA